MEGKRVATLKPVSRTTLSEQVARQLASELAAKRWKPGEKLPSEAQLCKAFNVGRSTLREALKSLSFIGLIRMRAGGGTYVAEQQSTYMHSPWLSKGVLRTEKDVNDLSETRLLLETEAAGLCADRGTDEDFESLEKIVTDMKAAVDRGGEGFQELDLRFHLAIAAGSKNQVLTELLKHIRDAMQELISKSLLLPAGRDMAYEQHRAILDVIKLRNGTKARNAMRAHLRAFQRGYKVLFDTARAERLLIP